MPQAQNGHLGASLSEVRCTHIRSLMNTRTAQKISISCRVMCNAQNFRTSRDGLTDDYAKSVAERCCDELSANSSQNGKIMRKSKRNQLTQNDLTNNNRTSKDHKQQSQATITGNYHKKNDHTHNNRTNNKNKHNNHTHKNHKHKNNTHSDFFHTPERNLMRFPASTSCTTRE